MEKNNDNDIIEIAQKLEIIRNKSISDYSFVKGFIHCMSLKEESIKKIEVSPTKK